MAFNTLVSFDRPLVGFARAGAGGRTYTESEMALRLEEAYQRGIDSARELADHQMVEFRSDVEQFGSEVLGKLGNLEPVLVAQLREALPALAVEIRTACDEHETIGIFAADHPEQPMTLMAILGKSGCLELTIVGDSARAMLGVPLGEKIVVRW